MEEIIYILEDFYYDHKKGVIATAIIFLIIIIFYVAFLMLYNPIKIRFEGDDSKIVATVPTKLEYKAIAYDKKINNYPLSWEVSAGVLNKTEGQNVVWELPNVAGSYTITAKCGKVEAVKTVTVMENVLLESLSESEIISNDADRDGLSDEYEKTISNTSFSKIDTDGDTLTDSDEILLGLDPTLVDSKNDGINDSQRSLEYKYFNKEKNIELEVKGKGNLTKTSIDTYEINSLENVNGILTPIFYIFSEADINSINVNLKYDRQMLEKKGVSEEYLAIYELDEETNNFIKLKSNLDKENTSISTEITKNSKIFIANSNSIKDKLSTEIMFVIDNSGSMYSKEQIAESEENDVDFKRLSSASEMVDKLKGDYKLGIGKFTFEYTELAALTENKEYVKEKIDSIKTLTEKFTGTYIGEALSGGLKQFSTENKEDARRYLILLTDGKDTQDVKGYDKNKIKEAIKEAKEKGVKVYVIGLGKQIDQKVLEEIATETSGKYYYALNADVLDSLFDIITSQINYSLVDSDNDNIDDSMVVADSGFITKRDGFSFDNIPYLSELNGCTYGMSLFSKLYYEKELPESLNKMTLKVANSNKIVKSNGFKKDNMNLKGYLYENEIKGLELLSKVPNDFRTGGIEDSVLKIKNEYKTLLQSVGFKIYNQDYNKSKSSFNKYEIFVLDMESNEFLKSMGSVGKAYFDAINRFDILKYRDDTISFKDDALNAMEKITETLNNSKCCLLKLNDSYTVNAIKIIQSKDEPNKFKIEVYDSNISGAKKYIECTRRKEYLFNVLNDENKNVTENYIYEFTYNDKNVDVKISIPNIAANI